jgi:hypothetical protein
MLHDRSPMAVIAFNEFQKTFENLFSVRAQVSDFERIVIESVYEKLFLRKDSKEWERRVRAAHHFLDHGALKSPKSVAEAFLNTAETMTPVLNAAIDTHKDMHDETIQSNVAIRQSLAYYKQLLEGPYRLLLAPVAVGFARVMGRSDNDFIPGEDGKIKLSTLPKIEQWTIYPQSQLTQGVNTHIRNAFSHENYRILDGWDVELWDFVQSRKGKAPKKWGPEIWNLDRIDSLCNDLELTNLALLTALALYSINHRVQIQERGWSSTIKQPKLTQKELKVTLEHFASQLSFQMSSFKIENNNVLITLKTEYPGISQNEEIFMGGDKWAKKYIVKVDYKDTPTAEQLLGLLQRTQELFLGYDVLMFSITDYKDRHQGDFHIKVSNLKYLVGPDKAPANEVRMLCVIDTLASSVMSVRIEHAPVEP